MLIYEMLSQARSQGSACAVVALADPATEGLRFSVVDLGKIEEEDRGDVDVWPSGCALVKALVHVCTVLGNLGTDGEVSHPDVVGADRENPPQRLWGEMQLLTTVGTGVLPL